MPVSELDRFVFDLRGFLVVPGVLDEGAVEAMRTRIDEWGLAQETEEERGKIEAIFDWGQAFLDLIDHPRTLPYVLDFVDEAARLDNAYAAFTIPGDTGIPLHAGVADGKAPWIPTSTTWYAVNDGQISSGLTKVCWALTDSPAGSGGFCCIPGSHTSRVRPPIGDDAEAAIEAGLAVEVPLMAGDAIVFTEALVHSWMPRRSHGNNRVLIYKYTPGYVRYFGREWLPEDLGKLSPSQRLLVEPPYVRDGDHEKRRSIG
jgi:hypothetical protein